MNKIKLILTVFLLLFIAFSAFPQTKFEGKVVYKMSGSDADEETQMTYFVKEGRMKIEVQGMEEGTGSMIFDSKKQTMLILMPEEKMYMEMPLNLTGSKNEEADETKFDFKKTGETKDILGYKCEKWIYTDEDNQVDSWLTKELGAFIFFADPMKGNAKRPQWQSELESEGFFPMELVVKDLSGNQDSRMVVTEVEKKTLDMDMFQAPPGYQKLEMPGMN